MRALRIILKQSMANYKKEETIDNKMTYPLPPLSTVIGALYSACGYVREQHPENIDIRIGIQGEYGSMQREIYRDYAFLNSVMNDRGTLVKLRNSQLLSNAFDVAAVSKASQGNDFEKEITIDVVNRELLEEYQQLRAKRRQLDMEKKQIDLKLKEYAELIKKAKKQWKELDKKSQEAKELENKIQEYSTQKQQLAETFLAKRKTVDDAYALFASVTTSIKSYEVLYDVHLVLHVLSDEKTMNDIKTHINNLKSIGRSEDYVDVQSVEYVELAERVEREVVSGYSAYLPYAAVKNGNIEMSVKDEGVTAQGTKYYMNKIYTIQEEKRIFQKEWVVYAENYSIAKDTEIGDETGIFFDGTYIAALI